MKKKVQHPDDGKSLKTLLLYGAAVMIVILGALALKAVNIMQQSKFTGEHFTLALAQNENVKEIIVFNPDDSSLSVLNVHDAMVPLSKLPRVFGVSPDGQISVKDSDADKIKDDISDALFQLGIRYSAIKTNLTIFDIGRLSLFAKNLPPNKITIKDISTADLTDNPDLERTLISFFSDDVLATENVSIQIINATGVSGMAQRLESVLVHQGANVVSISGAPQTQRKSEIKYFGEETYTLDKIKKLLGFHVNKLRTETIANIVIVIGESDKNTTLF
jgi:hypothetical protein